MSVRSKRLAAIAITLAVSCQPGFSADATWTRLREFRTDVKPDDVELVRIWKDVLKVEADQIRANGGNYYVRG